MNYFKSLALVAIIFYVVPFSVEAQNSGMTSIVTRMDQIIKEMQSLKAEFDKLSTQVVSSKGNVLGASTAKRLTKTPVFGETTDEISLIQKLLKTDPAIYPYQVVSGFFGPKTEEAIKNLQVKFNLDPVGVVGPATAELLEAFFAKYPNDEFPSNALASDPRGATPAVAGVSTSKSVSGVTTATPPAGGIGSIKAIQAEVSAGGALVAIYYKNGSIKEFKVIGATPADIIAATAAKSGLTVSTVSALITFNGIDETEVMEASFGDEAEAEEAIEVAEEAIEDAEDAIEAADEDGDDVDWAEDTLKEAEETLEEAEEAFSDEEYEEAIEDAEAAKESANDAEDRIDEEEDENEDDEIDEIVAEIYTDYTDITVRYEDDEIENYDFDVPEDDEDDIIEAVADELDLDNEEVEDLIEFDYGDLDIIDVDVDDGEAEVEVKFESDFELNFKIDEDAESVMITEIAERLNIDEDEVEDVIDFNY